MMLSSNRRNIALHKEIRAKESTASVRGHISLQQPIWEIYKSARAQIFPHYDSANELLRKRNSDRYREPQQRFTKPQTGLYMIRAMHSIPIWMLILELLIRTYMRLFNRSYVIRPLPTYWPVHWHSRERLLEDEVRKQHNYSFFYRLYARRTWPARLHIQRVGYR